jgi:hypothetical protein
MAPRRKIRQGDAQLAFEALSIEGGLLSPEWLANVAQLQADHQADADYRIPKGLNLRDEIGRYWRIAQAHWSELQAGMKAGAEHQALSERFVLALLRDVLGFSAVAKTEALHVGDRTYPVGHRALDGRVPIVIAPAASGLDTLALEFGDGTRRRSAFGLAQEYLNAEEKAVWGLASDALSLRILRDNASLTRPAWIEADLGRIFAEERYADFAALWLLAHETRFGAPDHPVADSPLEGWRTAGREEGTRAREFLRQGVEEALEALGRGFLAHPENQPIRAALQDGKLTPDALFQQLLRLVYRLIFLLTAEERGVLHPPDAADGAKRLYAEGYSLRRLRDRSVKRSAHDRFADLWEGLKIVLRGVARGQPLLGLPPLGGLFDADQCPHLDAAKLENRALLAAVFKLSWLRQGNSLSRVNWRDMGPEELGSVYESLLELVPVIPEDGRGFSFATGDETKGNARKTTGSYYTPDSLVQVLLDSALEPVVQQTIAAHPDKPAEALLQLSIVDPACGSGHFLLAAARRLAAHVARLQADGTPSAAEYRHALRQVVSRCLYGVDLNPMAVELCRVSLWMEAVEPGRPLSFLDSHIQQGNALLGATPELMAKGIPDAAFEPIEGDDKKTASLLKKKNKAAAEGQRGLESLWSKPAEAESAEVTKAVAALEAAPDASLEDVTRKEAQWDGLQRSLAFSHQKFVADAWCAAFVWPKPATEPKKVDPIVAAAPTNDLWRQIRDGQGKPPPETVRTVGELAGHYRFFQWHLAFPHVFAKGGFDVVLGNPPWERVNLKEKEFFAALRPDIASAPNAAARKRLIAGLAVEDPSLFAAYRWALRSADAEGHFARASGRFPLCGRGDINTYSVFAETATALLSGKGRAGLIVPAGIATDETTKYFFQSVVGSQTLVSLFGFENEEFLFPGVHHATKFCLLSLTGRESRVEQATFSFFARRVSDIHLKERRFELSAGDFESLNPLTRTCPVFRARTDAELVRAIHRRIPILSSEQTGSWNASMTRMFHMSDDASLFRTRAELERKGFTERAGAMRRDNERWVPLYEAKMMQLFDHRFGTYAGQSDAQSNQGILPRVTVDQHNDSNFTVEPWFWVPFDEVEKWRQEKGLPRWLLVWRKITRNTDSRTLIPAVLPACGVGDSLQILLVPGASPTLLTCLVANLSSLVADYIARQKVAGTNLSHGYLSQLPVLPPAKYGESTSWAGVDLASWISARSVELLCTSRDVADLGNEAGFVATGYRWDESRRAALRAELDAAFLLLYGLDRRAAEHVLDSFAALRDAEVSAAEEYRTKSLVLECFDAMSRAAEMGTRYQTRLDPPPADPRVAHEAKTRERRSSR